MADFEKESLSNLSEETSLNENTLELSSKEEKQAVASNVGGAKACFNNENKTDDLTPIFNEINGKHSKQSNFDKRNEGNISRDDDETADRALNEMDEQNDDENYESAEEFLSPEEAEERLKEALELKKKGNDHFRSQEYTEAQDLYTKAIKYCPKEETENKSIFYANRAACCQKLEDYENGISDCDRALELSPNYLKARLRRAQCYEKVDKLEEALEDYRIVFENDKTCHLAHEAILRLPDEIKIKHEKLKDEMIGKLKDLGNMVLRPFGLSTDNFKLQQDPNSGGYSINFQK